MGLTLQFAIGDKDEIVDAVADEDFEMLEKLESEKLIADFSFHFVPDDLNPLFRIVGKQLNSKVDNLRPYLDFEKCFFDEVDRGAYHVDNQIKENFALLKLEESEKITRLWINELNLKYNDEIAVSDALVKAVYDLICLCKAAVNTDQDLVHIWLG